MLAAGSGSGVMVRALLDAGADPGIKDRNGNTARFHAANAGYMNLADFLEQSEK